MTDFFDLNRESYNQGLVDGFMRASEMISAAVVDATQTIEREAKARSAAYGVRLGNTHMPDLEAAARALCIIVGLDPDKPTRPQIGVDEVPLWTLRTEEAAAVVLAIKGGVQNDG